MEPSFDTIQALLSPAAFASIRSAASFRATAEAMAQGELDIHAGLDPATLWLTKDLGRVSLYLAMLILHATLGKVSVHDLANAAAMNKTCSRGRVLAFIDYAQAAGRLCLPPGEEHWTKRPLRLQPSFFEYGENRFWREMESVALIAREVGQALRHRSDPRAFPAALVALGQLTVLRRDLFYETGVPILTFMKRDAGLRILYDWITQQRAGRAAFMEDVVLAKTELSRRHKISRAHLDAMLSDVEGEGLLSTPTSTRIVFTDRLSEDLERHFSFLISIDRITALAVLSACGSPAGASAAGDVPSTSVAGPRG